MKSDDTVPRAQGRIVELDDARGLTAFSVVAAHYFGEVPHGFAALTVGWIGVDHLYLVHQPVSGLLHGLILDATPDLGSVAAIAVTVLAFAASVGIAAASWKWFEQPIIAWAHRGQLAPTPAAA